MNQLLNKDGRGLFVAERDYEVGFGANQDGKKEKNKNLYLRLNFRFPCSAVK